MEERIQRRVHNRDSRASSLLEFERQEDEPRIQKFLDELEQEEREEKLRRRIPSISMLETSAESSQVRYHNTNDLNPYFLCIELHNLERKFLIKVSWTALYLRSLAQPCR